MKHIKQNTIAIVYDFDGTLTPLPMQEYTVFPEAGITAKDFWSEAKAESRRLKADGILVYMRLMIEKFAAQGKVLKRADLAALASNIKYFPGVESWFDRIAAYVKDVSGGVVSVKHYIISAGNKEIIDGCSICSHFAQVYGNEYYYNDKDIATFPSVVINDTTKTQFLFRINKGREDLNESVHEHMPHELRPIPFENILYIGDGMTDVPCMILTRMQKGHSVAVHNDEAKDIGTCRELVEAGRIDCYAKADYTEGSDLDHKIKTILDLKVANIKYRNMKNENKCFHSHPTSGITGVESLK